MSLDACQLDFTAFGYVLAFSVLLGQSACAAGEKRTPAVSAEVRTVRQHGIVIGDSFARVPLWCDPGGLRDFPSDAEFELVTFSTPSDCSACLPHLAGLDTLQALGRLPTRNYYVVWAPGRDSASVIRTYRSITSRTVCLDRSGLLWHKHGIGQTPVSVGVKEGRVVYLNDLPLASPAVRTQLLRDLDDVSK